MATANITRDEAIARSRVISTEAYRVTVDLTGREVAEPERVFLSTTELSLTAHGGDTYVDLIADEVREASLDGEPFETAGFDGYRLPLPHLEEGPHQVRVVAVCRVESNRSPGWTSSMVLPMPAFSQTDLSQATSDCSMGLAPGRVLGCQR